MLAKTICNIWLERLRLLGGTEATTLQSGAAVSQRAELPVWALPGKACLSRPAVQEAAAGAAWPAYPAPCPAGLLATGQHAPIAAGSLPGAD